MFEKFTDKAIKVIMLAQEEARRFKYNSVGTDFIFLGLIAEATGIAAKILQSQGIKLKQARQELTKIIGIGTDIIGDEIPFTPKTKELLERAVSMAEQLESSSVGTEHLLMVILQDQEIIPVKILQNLNINSQNLVKALSDYFKNPNNPNLAQKLGQLVVSHPLTPQESPTNPISVKRQSSYLNPYDVLEISPDTPMSEIPKAFTKAMKDKKYSADVIAKARRSLMNPKERLIADYLRPILPTVGEFKYEDDLELEATQSNLELLAEFDGLEEAIAMVEGISEADRRVGLMLKNINT